MKFEIPNTLKIRAFADAGGVAKSVSELRSHQARAKDLGLPFIVLGEGSNIVPKEEVNGYVCVSGITGRDLVGDGDSPCLRVGAGENWHQLVLFCARNGYHGLENLALIPGSVGAAPIQNIGAYGVELSSFIRSVEVVDREGEHQVLDQAQCQFSYRDSIFKGRTDLSVVAITLALSRQHVPNLSYPDLAQRCSEQISPEELLQTVIAIRRAKLPDPFNVPNVGSFFKNPIVSTEVRDALVEKFPEIKSFSDPQGWKLSAAQLIDLGGWKSRSDEHVACWSDQPLVLINRGGATSSQILAFAKKIEDDIAARFQIQLELEPSVLS